MQKFGTEKDTMPSEWMEYVPGSISPPPDNQKSPHTIFHGGVNRPDIPGLNPSSEYDPLETLSQPPLLPEIGEALMQAQRRHRDAQPQSARIPLKPLRGKSIQAIIATNDNDSLFGDSDPESDSIPLALNEHPEILMSGALRSSLPVFPPESFQNSSHKSDLVSPDDHQSRYEESAGDGMVEEEEEEQDQEEEYEPADFFQTGQEYRIDDARGDGRGYDPSRPWMLGSHAQEESTLQKPSEKAGEGDQTGNPPSPSESELVSTGFEFHQDVPEDVQIAQFGHSAHRDASRKVQPDIPRKQQWHLFREVEKALKEVNPDIAKARVPEPRLGVSVCGCNGDYDRCNCSPWSCPCGGCDHGDEIDHLMRIYWQRGSKSDSIDDRVDSRAESDDHRGCSCLPGLCHCAQKSLMVTGPGTGDTRCNTGFFINRGPPRWQDVFPKGELLDTPDHRWAIKSTLPPLPWKTVQSFRKEVAAKGQRMTLQRRKDAILEFYAWEQRREAEALKGTTPKAERRRDQHGQNPSLASSSLNAPKCQCLADVCICDQGQEQLVATDLATLSPSHEIAPTCFESGSGVPTSRPDTPRPPLDSKITTPYASDVNHSSIRQSVEPELPSAEWYRESTPAYEDRSQSPSPISIQGDVQMLDTSLGNGPGSSPAPVPLRDAGSSSARNETVTPRQPQNVTTTRLSSPLKQPKRNDRIKYAVQGSKVEKRSVTGSPSKGRNVTRRATNLRPPPAAVERIDKVKTQLEKDMEVQEAPKPGTERVSGMVADIEARESKDQTEDGTRQRDGTPVRRSSRANKGIRSSPGYAEEFS